MVPFVYAADARSMSILELSLFIYWIVLPRSLLFGFIVHLFSNALTIFLGDTRIPPRHQLRILYNLPLRSRCTTTHPTQWCEFHSPPLASCLRDLVETPGEEKKEADNRFLIQFDTNMPSYTHLPVPRSRWWVTVTVTVERKVKSWCRTWILLSIQRGSAGGATKLDSPVSISDTLSGVFQRLFLYSKLPSSVLTRSCPLVTLWYAVANDTFLHWYHMSRS